MQTITSELTVEPAAGAADANLAAARIHESGGNLLAAAETLRQLAAVDRRFRTEYLTNVAKLESRLGRKEQAMGSWMIAGPPNRSISGSPHWHPAIQYLFYVRTSQDCGSSTA